MFKSNSTQILHEIYILQGAYKDQMNILIWFVKSCLTQESMLQKVDFTTTCIISFQRLK
jgi:hypothetical protein